MWSWRDSNSRPNEELICFLHAYLRLDFRVTTRPKPPIATLFPFVSSDVRDFHQTISDTSAPPYRTLRSHSFRVTSRPNTLCKDKALNYYTSIQAARAKFLSPVNFLSTEIKVPANDALHAYKPLLPAVKTGQPQVVVVRAAKKTLFF